MRASIHPFIFMHISLCVCVCLSCRYGPLNRVEIKRNYAFVEFKELDDAIDAQKRSHGTVFDGRTITVEFVESSRLGRGDRCVCVCVCTGQKAGAGAVAPCLKVVMLR